ncbi:hypothetical protein Q4568_23905, partial [Photobacterium sanguinicancri]|nr:hypothetical protein [Photobacterium sanguinicancri]
MKNKKSIIFSIMLSLFLTACGGGGGGANEPNDTPQSKLPSPVELTIEEQIATTFPDTILASCVQTVVDDMIANGNTPKILSDIKHLNCRNEVIESTEGIELLINLDSLYINSDKITAIDLSSNEKLRYLT